MSDRTPSTSTTTSSARLTVLDILRGLRQIFVGGIPATYRAGCAILRSALRAIESFLFDAPKALYGLAITRILMAFTALGILITNFSTRYYAFGTGSAWTGELASPESEFPKLWIFSFFQDIRAHDTWFTISYVALAGLAVLLLLGYRTKLTTAVFLIAWVSFIELNDMLGDQGDNIFRIVLLFMLFTDAGARWSLDSRRRTALDGAAGVNWTLGQRFVKGLPIVPVWLRNVSNNLALVIIASQVSMVYVSGAFYKASGEPWANGTALYDPIHTVQFGTWPELSDFVTAWGPFVAALSYATILVQAFFPAMLLHPWTRRLALIVILGFHLGIALLMGLPWFSLSMIAVDAIFVRDESWRTLSTWLREAFRTGAGRASLPDTSNEVTASDTAVNPAPDHEVVMTASFSTARQETLRPRPE